ncbi:MAG: Type I signal peptidase [Candidatus Roizmanbacteria bacterium GW2011_GWA2_36_23]|uniref:Signal peptidase I n=1 Tax=Candidatus Roizmanbacteria bacterium GW2011_GWA2_36_23 TaxID=1618480 RepID=A0A0G0ELR9_9BACT|nr:MAG: Type I signal peptidase [Candidatus Roizmanbacteria bacterium GW2011_GWA2_36_23]
MKAIKIVFDIFSWLLLGSFILLVIFTLGSNTNMLGGYKSFLVQSGSMEPTIMIGDIIISHKQYQYNKNDVVTFMNADQRVVTHRIIEASVSKDKTSFITKGDANRSEDSDLITDENIIGKVIFIIPKLGYLVGFIKTPIGLVVFMVLPALALIVNELVKIFSKNA